MTNHNALAIEYKEKLAEYLECDPDNIFLYWKGRAALYAILKAMEIGAGDEVIVQAYTCVVVANAIIYLGAIPVYVDIDPTTYNINVNLLAASITEKTKAVICQNTYGLSSNLNTITDIARQHNIYTIEDCTHGFGGYYKGQPNGSYCDASFFSTQWSKPYSTGIGGFSVVHHSTLQKKVGELEKEKVQPGIPEILNLKALYGARYLINDLTYWPMVNLYRFLSKNNLVVGSSSGGEIDSTEVPAGYFKDISVCQIKKGLKSLQALNSVNALRKKNAQTYTDYLKRNDKNHVNQIHFDDHMFLRYPLLVHDREAFREAALRKKVILGEWFDCPLYPVNRNLAAWYLDSTKTPVANQVCDSIVNLPTDVTDVGKVIELLDENRGKILPETN